MEDETTESLKSEVIVDVACLGDRQDDGSNPESEIYNIDGQGEDSQDWIVPEIGSSKKSTTSFLDPSKWSRTTLTEEEALKKFFSRAQAPKYVNARFKCASCFTNFARRDKLEQHFRVNHDEEQGQHMCRLCKRRFQKPCKLRVHLKKHYLVIQCLRCDASFNGEGLAFQHEEFHRGVSFSCKYCAQQFRHKSTYYQHVRTRHRSSHVCAECGASFGSPAGLNVHKKRRHYRQDTPGPQDNIYCKRCDIKFSSVEAFHEHYRHSAMHGEDNTEESNGNVNECDVNLSNARFKQRSRHPMQCEVCKRTFGSFSACMKHHTAAHAQAPPPAAGGAAGGGGPDPRVHCELCGAYIKESSMYTHMNAHTRQKLYTCEICSMQFPYPTSLNRHRVTHTGEKKYPCPLCDKRFTQRNSMSLHYRTYHLKEPYPKRNRSKKKKVENEEAKFIQVKVLGS